MTYKSDYKFTDDEVIKDLKGFKSGRYAIIPTPTPMRPEDVDTTLQRFSNYHAENWRSLEAATALTCTSLDERLTTLLEAKNRCLDAAQVMGHIAALTATVDDAMTKKESYGRCMAIGTQHKGRYKGLHLETMCLQLPPRLAQVQGTIAREKDKREDVYAIFMEIVRASLPKIIEKFSTTRLGRDDPWKPVSDLLYAYET